MNDPIIDLYGSDAENDVIENIPDAYAALGIMISDLYGTLKDYLIVEDIDPPFYALLDFFGDTDKLASWKNRITGEIKTYVDDVHTDLNLAASGSNFRDGWTGSAANAFHDYVPTLLTAIDALSTNLDDIAGGLQIHIDALTAVKTKFIEVLGNITAEVLDIEASSDESDVKQSKIKGVYNGFVSNVGGILAAVVNGGFEVWAAIEGADSSIGSAYSALVDAQTPAGLVDVPDQSGPYQGSEGVSGYQLPMPTDSVINQAWSAEDITEAWSRETSITMDPFMGFLSELRNQAESWQAAAEEMHELNSDIVKNAEAFSIGLGAGTYEACYGATYGRYQTLKWSDTRFNELADALALIAEEFGAVDESASEDISVEWRQLKNG